jgi:HAD superfamily hydrolase (TIGR01509 family)
MGSLKANRVVGVLFDWDGVLIDSLGAAFNVYNKIFARVGPKVLTREEYLQLQSPNWYEFYFKVGLPASLWKEVDQEWLRLYEEESPGLHSDALGCLTALRKAGLKLALVSNGSRSRVEKELARFDLRGFFEVVLFGEDKEELKPSPVMIQRALYLMGIEPRDALYVGDSPADIRAARNAKVSSIAIARESIQSEQLSKEEPDHVFAGLDEMTIFLLGGVQSTG